MPAICLCLDLHLPFVLRRFSIFDTDIHYFDNYRTRDVCRRYAVQSILPVNRILHSQLRRFEGRFRLSLAVSGTALDVLAQCTPDVLDSFRELAETGHVEFLAVPHDYGLAFALAPEEFAAQVTLHCDRIAALFDCRPRVLRNTALIYAHELAEPLPRLGLAGALCEGVDEVLAGRSCDHVYAAGDLPLRLLPRNTALSRLLPERFADRSWSEWPLTAPKFADLLTGAGGEREVVTLGWDYRLFGLGLGADTGILDFLRFWPEKVLENPGRGLDFVTASQAIERFEPCGEFCPSDYLSAAEYGGDLSAWLGNPLQSDALHRLYGFEEEIRALGGSDNDLLVSWRRLQAADYVQEMGTGPIGAATRGVAAAGFDSPYDVYINFMNICDSIAARVRSGDRLAVSARER
jgi:alpha-amylase